MVRIKFNPKYKGDALLSWTNARRKYGGAVSMLDTDHTGRYYYTIEHPNIH